MASGRMDHRWAMVGPFHHQRWRQRRWTKPVSTPIRGCGQCCMHMGSPPFDVTIDGDRLTFAKEPIPPGMPSELLDGIRLYAIAASARGEPYLGWKVNPDVPCSWLDLETMLCRNYQFRPQVCRTFDCHLGGYADCCVGLSERPSPQDAIESPAVLTHQTSSEAPSAARRVSGGADN